MRRLALLVLESPSEHPRHSETPSTFNWISSWVQLQNSRKKKKNPEQEDTSPAFVIRKPRWPFSSRSRDMFHLLLVDILLWNIFCLGVGPLPAAIRLSPKHSRGSWQFKNTPWHMIAFCFFIFFLFFLQAKVQRHVATLYSSESFDISSSACRPC